jgi:hypothetical protein
MTKEEKAEYSRRYREAHRVEMIEKKRHYNKNNKEKIAEYDREYKIKNINHKVYLLELPDNRMYVGSTNFLNKRLGIHKQDSRRHPDQLLYKAIKETGGWDQVKVHVLMHDIPDYQLRLKLEQHFINKIPEQLVLNTIAVAI